jgi:hypothetical protein
LSLFRRRRTIRPVTRWIALAVLAAMGATMLLTWPQVDAETGPEKARSLYGYRACAAPCALDASYVAFRVNKLFAAHTRPADWPRKRVERAPAIGAIALYGDHYAFVERVLAPGAIEVTELDADRLTRRTVTRGDGWPDGFILIGPRTTHEAPPVSGDSTLI